MDHIKGGPRGEDGGGGVRGTEGGTSATYGRTWRIARGTPKGVTVRKGKSMEGGAKREKTKARRKAGE